MKKINWKKAGIWLSALIALVLFWVLKCSDTSRPIAHVPGILDGKFKVSVGAVREIVIQGEKSEEPIDLTITIRDENQETAWQESFEGVEVTGDRQTLISFEKEAPLVLEQKNYYAELTLDAGAQESIWFSIIEYNADFKGMYLGLSILFLLTIALALLIYDNIKVPIHLAYFILAITLSMVFGCIMPPLSAGDEYSHFLQAYKLSSKMMNVQFHTQGYVALRADDYDSAVYLHDMASISDWYETFERGNIDEMVPAAEHSTVTSRAWYIYLPSAIGISLARILHCSGHVLLIMGRLFNLLTVALLFLLAIKTAPRGKLFFACFGLVPEILYFANSFSYDGINIALCTLLAAYFLYMYESLSSVKVKHIAIFVIIFLLMLPIKAVYVWLGLLLLLLPIKKLSVSRKTIIIAGAVGLSGCLILGYMYLPLLKDLILSGAAPSTGARTNEGVSLSFIMSNPRHLIDCFFNSTFQDVNGFIGKDQYVAAALGQVMASDRYAGRDIYLLPSWLCVIIIFVFGICLEDTSVNQIGRVKRYLTAAIGAGIYFSVLLAMYFTSTKIIDRKVYGVQGRYLLPICVLFPLIFKNQFFFTKIDRRKWSLFLMVFVNLLFMLDTFWHYAYVYFAQPVA